MPLGSVPDQGDVDGLGLVLVARTSAPKPPGCPSRPRNAWLRVCRPVVGLDVQHVHGDQRLVASSPLQRDGTAERSTPPTVTVLSPLPRIDFADCAGVVDFVRRRQAPWWRVRAREPSPVANAGSRKVSGSSGRSRLSCCRSFRGCFGISFGLGLFFRLQLGFRVCLGLCLGFSLCFGRSLFLGFRICRCFCGCIRLSLYLGLCCRLSWPSLPSHPQPELPERPAQPQVPQLASWRSIPARV